VTIAAELEGAAEFTRHAASKGITVSVGHSLATAADLETVAEAGATMLTHLGNGMPNMVQYSLRTPISRPGPALYGFI
jgi:N-acetylglucosamine-6-phosphate deacetylase